MQKSFALSIFFLTFLMVPVAVGALTEPISGNQTSGFHNQSQVFVSSTTSLVRQEDRHACVQSAGTDWKATSTAISATDQTAVDLQNLQSNTPFVSHIRPASGPGFLRLALGFRVTNGSVKFETPRGDITGIRYGIEPRGDTIVVKDQASITRMLGALRSEDGLRITAQSEKLMGDAPEHIVSHLFKLGADEDGLSACRDLALKPAPSLTNEVRIGLAAMPREDADIDQFSAVACNRDIDPKGAELVAFGSVSGIALPLSHALIKRDEAGRISAIWAGDLLRIDRQNGSFQARISNSIRSQGPLGEQNVSACTRMSAPRCVDIVENNRGRISISHCFEDLIGLASGPFLGQNAPRNSNGLSPAGYRSGGGGGGVRGGGFGGSGGSPAVSGLGTLPSGEESIFVLASSDPQRDTDGGDSPTTPTTPQAADAPNPNVVPLPGGFVLLILSLGMAIGIGRRRAAQS